MSYVANASGSHIGLWLSAGQMVHTLIALHVGIATAMGFYYGKIS